MKQETIIENLLSTRYSPRHLVKTQRSTTQPWNLPIQQVTRHIELSNKVRVQGGLMCRGSLEIGVRTSGSGSIGQIEGKASAMVGMVVFEPTLKD